MLRRVLIALSVKHSERADQLRQGQFWLDRFVDPDDQALINQQRYRLLFGVADPKVQPITLGEGNAKTKAATAEADVRRTWILFGDPTMRVK